MCKSIKKDYNDSKGDLWIVIVAVVVWVLDEESDECVDKKVSESDWKSRRQAICSRWNTVMTTSIGEEDVKEG